MSRIGVAEAGSFQQGGSKERKGRTDCCTASTGFCVFLFLAVVLGLIWLFCYRIKEADDEAANDPEAGKLVESRADRREVRGQRRRDKEARDSALELESSGSETEEEEGESSEEERRLLAVQRMEKSLRKKRRRRRRRRVERRIKDSESSEMDSEESTEAGDRRASRRVEAYRRM